jgi:hypothetical protein
LVVQVHHGSFSATCDADGIVWIDDDLANIIDSTGSAVPPASRLRAP